ncbi:hypothetical protein SUDANB58_03358 [Streptomyces sp. enrichment culture]|uniref:hypothetical protein n=1 Tax=Streptomyces sp. enrichment culture TaxID=1795815 RepID=UPI003F568594
MSPLKAACALALTTALSLITAPAHADGHGDKGGRNQLDKTRAATDQYREVSHARKAGYLPLGPCTELSGEGGMGYHYVKQQLINSTDPARPAAMVYHKDEKDKKDEKGEKGEKDEKDKKGGKGQKHEKSEKGEKGRKDQQDEHGQKHEKSQKHEKDKKDDKDGKEDKDGKDGKGEKDEHGKLRLGAVEWIVRDADQNVKTDWDRPVMFGDVKFDGPQKLPGLGVVYTLHAWTHKDNPRGVFHPWNPKVTCS